MFEAAVVADPLREELARLRADGSKRSIAELVDLVAHCQSVTNTANAVQTLAMAHIAAIEDVELEDGTVVEQHRGLGHQRLDAPALVSEQLGVTDAGASTRMSVAVDVVTRMPAVLDAMASGRLDGYRAGIVCEELRDAPLPVCRDVVTRISASLGAEPAGALRRRVRRALGAVDAEFVRAKAVRARSARSLRRWPGDEPGVDTWVGSFPVEQARSGWAVIDGLARQYVQDGRSTGVDQARADALMDLIHSRATGTFVVQLAVPAVGAAREADREVGTGPVRGADPQADPGAGTDAPSGLHAGWDDTDGAGDAGHVVTVAGLGMPGFTQVRRDWIRRLVSRATDEPSHVKAPDPTHQSDDTQAHDAIAAPGPSTTTRSEVVTCHADTGALMSVQPSAGVRGNRARATKAYRPPLGLVELVKARDGRCRFPGCTVSAAFCDLDHVRPWPSGPTRATNLMCLCRRHHRIKQTARWRVRIEPDASVTWTDPTGRVRTTLPLDFLQGAREDPVTRSDRASREPRLSPAPGQRPPRSPRDDTGDHWSAWEDELTHWVATAERDRARRRAERHPPARSLHPPYCPALTWHAVAVDAGARPLDLPPPGHGSRASPRRRASSAGAEEPPPF